MRRTIFITGATGNIGGKIVCEILRTDPSAKMVLLVRGKSKTEAHDRLVATIRKLSPDNYGIDFDERIEVACGDITRPNLGLNEQQIRNFESGITHIIHAAAETKFDQSYETAYTTNIQGTVNITAFAQRLYEHGCLKQFAYISTAFVCGRNVKLVFEDQMPKKPQFSNNYERSKWEAEQYVKSLIPQLPIVIFRPSIVIGDSTTGRLVNFNVLYTPLRFICQGNLPVIPCNSTTALDIVPVDYVAAAICHIMFKTSNADGRIYHITAGNDNQPTIGEIVTQAVEYINNTNGSVSVKRPRYVRNSVFNTISRFLPRKLKKIMNILKVFEPYVVISRRFDCTNTFAALAGSGIYPPKPSQYLGNVLGCWLNSTRTIKTRKAA
ncbi:MAG: SDR family oxidoreductase [Candidatus Zixiibacteriota bacterium]